jgi:hypothetical protein
MRYSELPPNRNESGYLRLWEGDTLKRERLPDRPGSNAYKRAAGQKKNGKP